MGDVSDHVRRARRLQCVGGITQRTGAVGDIIDQDAETVFHIADDVHHLRHASLFAAFVDDGERSVIQALGNCARPHDAADVG